MSRIGFLSLLLLLAVVAAAFCQSDAPDNKERESESSRQLTRALAKEKQRILLKHSIIPDVVPKVLCNMKLRIHFKEASAGAIFPGSFLKPKFCKRAPLVEFEAENGEFFTLMMVDPDAPTPTEPRNRLYRHWLVSNIPSDTIVGVQHVNMSAGDVLTEYSPPNPPREGGRHRYVFLLYRQKEGRIDFDPVTASRARWDVTKFTRMYKLGSPTAATFMLAIHDDAIYPPGWFDDENATKDEL